MGTDVNVSLAITRKATDSRQDRFAMLDQMQAMQRAASLRALPFTYPHLATFCLALVPSSSFVSQRIHVL